MLSCRIYTHCRKVLFLVPVFLKLVSGFIGFQQSPMPHHHHYIPENPNGVQAVLPTLNLVPRSDLENSWDRALHNLEHRAFSNDDDSTSVSSTFAMGNMDRGHLNGNSHTNLSKRILSELAERAARSQKALHVFKDDSRGNMNNLFDHWRNSAMNNNMKSDSNGIGSNRLHMLLQLLHQFLKGNDYVGGLLKLLHILSQRTTRDKGNQVTTVFPKTTPLNRQDTFQPFLTTTYKSTFSQSVKPFSSSVAAMDVTRLPTELPSIKSSNSRADPSQSSYGTLATREVASQQYLSNSTIGAVTSQSLVNTSTARHVTSSRLNTTPTPRVVTSPSLILTSLTGAVLPPRVAEISTLGQATWNTAVNYLNNYITTTARPTNIMHPQNNPIHEIVRESSYTSDNGVLNLNDQTGYNLRWNSHGQGTIASNIKIESNIKGSSGGKIHHSSRTVVRTYVHPVSKRFELRMNK